MPRESRSANLTPVHVQHTDGFHGIHHWKWEAYVSWQHELVCMLYVECGFIYKTKKKAIEGATKILRRMGVKCIHQMETKNEVKRPEFCRVP